MLGCNSRNVGRRVRVAFAFTYVKSAVHKADIVTRLSDTLPSLRRFFDLVKCRV
jgi:hypothetical protein